MKIILSIPWGFRPDANVQLTTLRNTLFEILLFPTCLVVGSGAMFFLLYHDLYVEAAYFAIPLSVMFLVLVLERLHPINSQWNKNSGDMSTDLYSLVIVAMGLEPLMTAIGPAIAVLILSMITLPSSFSIFVGVPFWLEVLIVILMIDFNKYWYHRFSHTNAFLWRFHSSHHSVKRMYLLNGFRLHPLYHTATYFLAILPPVVLGASQQALIMHSVVLGIAGSFQHANIKLQHGPLNWVFSTNELHRWHHSNIISEGCKNCGAIFSFWDIMFGTYLKDLNRTSSEMGIHGEEFYPMNNYWKQLLVPFLWNRWIAEPMKQKKDTPDS